MDKYIWNTIKSHYPKSQKLSVKTLTVWIADVIYVVVSVSLFKFGNAFIPISWLFLSVALIHFYIFQHEATHSSIAKNKYVNNFSGHLFSWLILMPFLARKRSHLLHHQFAGHPIKDPANNRVIEKFQVMTSKEAERLEFIWKSWIPLLVINDRLGLWFAPFQKGMGKDKNSQFKKERYTAIVYIFLYLSVIAALFINHCEIYLFGWYLPPLIILFYIEELINLPHHAETPLLDKEQRPLHLSQQYKVTHSCEKIPVWSDFILLNFNCHTPHHLYPWVPWYELPKLQDTICSYSHSIETKTQNEILWSLKNRKRSILKIMGHYFECRG